MTDEEKGAVFNFFHGILCIEFFFTKIICPLSFLGQWELLLTYGLLYDVFFMRYGYQCTRFKCAQKKAGKIRQINLK